MMRTTLNLDDDILAAARSLAGARNVSIGRIVSELARKGLAPRPMSACKNGFPIFEVAPDAGPITPETVDRLEDDE